MASEPLLSTLPVEVFESIFHHAFDGIAISENGKVIYVNPGLAAMYGLTAEEMVGRFTYDFAQPGESARVIRGSSLSNEVQSYRAKGLRKDGSVIHGEIRSYPYAWEGRTLRLTALRDVTAAVEAAEKVQESERRFRTFIETAEEGIVQLDAETRIVFVNPRMGVILGYLPEEMIGRSILDFLPAEEAARVKDRLAARKGGKREQYDLAYLHKNGSTVWMINSAAPLYAPDGSFQGSLGFHTDITERRRAEEALRESNELFESTFEQAAVGIAHTTPGGAWLRFNARLCEILGVTAGQLSETSFRDFLSDDDFQNNAQGYRKLLGGESPQFASEERYLRGDGNQVWVRLTASLVRDEQGRPKYFVTICQDITSEKAVEDKLAQLRSQMLFSTKASALGEIANGIAHEINNPLSVILAYTDVLREAEPAAGRAHFLANLEKIDATVNRITQIVRSLVVFTRDAHREPLETVNSASLVQDALSLCESRLRNSRITCERGEGAEGVELECRPVPLSQVLLNLLNNAADAVEGLETRWIRVSSEDLGSELLIAVEDSGAGVAPELRGKIMQPFYTTKPPHQGTGLGLAISRKIVESHRGTLKLDSSVPHTRFEVRLPKRHGPEQVGTAGG